MPRSLRITGTVAEWEEWTETPFPESGTYVFPHCLAPLEVDREADLGAYWEPNVWVRHPVRLSPCGSSPSSTSPTPRRASSPTRSPSAGTSSTSG